MTARPHLREKTRVKIFIFLSLVCLALCPGTRAENDSAKTPGRTAAPSACGPPMEQLDRAPLLAPHFKSRPAPGKALVYFFADATQHPGFGAPTVRIGVDGRWAGAILGTSYVAIDLPPGGHHICASLSAHWAGRLVELDTLDAQPGKTYFFTILMLNDWHGGIGFLLNRTDPDEAAMLLEMASERSSAHARLHPNHKWNRHRRAHDPNPLKTAAALRACGPSATKFAVSLDPKHAAVFHPNPGDALIYVLFDPHTTFSVWAPGGPVVNAGMDGRWAGALKNKSYLPLNVPIGMHHLCFEQNSRTWGHSVQLESVNAQAGRTYFLRVFLLDSVSVGLGSGRGPTAFTAGSVDKDEGNLLVQTSALSVSKQQPVNSSQP